MKVYEIVFNKCGFDQYGAFIVIAKSRQAVIKYLKKEYPGSTYGGCIDWNGGYTIKEIKSENYKDTEIVLGSFNAG